MVRERECGMADIVFTAAEDPPRLRQRDFLLKCLSEFKGRCSRMNPCHSRLRNNKMTQVLQCVAFKRAGFINAVNIPFNKDLPT